MLTIGAVAVSPGNYCIVLAVPTPDVSTVSPFRYAIVASRSLPAFWSSTTVPMRSHGEESHSSSASAFYTYHHERLRAGGDPDSARHAPPCVIATPRPD